jgi:hypothetical protein
MVIPEGIIAGCNGFFCNFKLYENDFVDGRFDDEGEGG